ncbi:unnamed protein product [Dicrocoelium dendriticum]|nr:unnamed protein product [Dicrocoelium dendriticum]CAH8656885.1 unnamed protein product [Dicrocoelium dendriticum]
MHQSLKLMEPRALRRTHERVLSIRSATGSSVSQRSIEAGVFDDFLIAGRFTNPVDGMSSFTNTTSDPLHAVSDSPTASDVCILTDSALPGIDLPMNIADHGSELTLGVPFANLHQLDPASPSLADGACVLGQAQKSRQFQMDSWSVLRATAPWKEFISDVTFHPSLFVESSHGGSTSDAFDFKFPARRPLRPRRRRSRGKPLNSMIQPSLARLSEEGSSVSSSPVISSSVSVDNAETDGIPFSFVPASLLSSDRRMASSYLLAECLTRIGTQNDLPTLNRSNHNSAIDGQVEHLMDHSLCYYHPPDVRQLPISLPVCSSNHLPLVLSSSCVTETNSIVHDLILPIDRVSSMSCLQPMLSFRTVPSDFHVSVRFAIHEPSIVPSPLTSFCALPSATHTVSSSIVNAIFSGHTLDGESAMFPNLRAPLARPESVATPESFLPKGDDHSDVNVIKHAYDDATALSVLSLSGLEWKKLQQMKILSRYRTSGQVVSHSSSDMEEPRYMKPGFRRRRHRCLTVLSCVTSHPSRKRWRSGKFEEESKNVETEAQCTRVPVDLDAVVTTVNSIDLPDHTAALKSQKTYSQPVSTSLVSGAITSHIISMASAVPCTSSGVFEPLGRGRSKGVKTVEGGISTQCLLRANGLVLDYLPPVFAELDVLTCASTEGTGSEGQHVPPDVSGIHPEASFYEFQWLEAARWVQYEEDFDPLTGDFGQAHSPLLMFHAVVECLRYLERGVVLLPFDSSVSRTSTESSDTVRVGEDYLFSIELEAALDSLLTHCDASLSEVALIRRVLQLHHSHKCELRQKQRSGRPLSYIRARCDSVTSESPQHGLRNVAVYDQPTGNHDSKSAHPNSRRSTHLSGLIDTPTSVTSIKNRAVSVLRRLSSAAHRHLCYTRATEGNHNSATCSTLHPCATDNQFSHPERVRTVGLVDIASKHASDLEGRLSPLTEVVSVHVGVLPGLRKPLFTFIRLYRPAYSSELTELHDAYPIRFVLLFLGPQQSNVDYCEVGRVLATMMVDRLILMGYLSVSRPAVVWHLAATV